MTPPPKPSEEANLVAPVNLMESPFPEAEGPRGEEVQGDGAIEAAFLVRQQ